MDGDKSREQHAWSIAMEHAKNYESDAKLSEIYEQNELHLFSGQCILQFLSTSVLQGSVATCVNYDRIFIDSFTASLLQSVMVKNLENQHFLELQAKIKWHLFSGHGVVFRIYTVNHKNVTFYF